MARGFLKIVRLAGSRLIDTRELCSARQSADSFGVGSLSLLTSAPTTLGNGKLGRFVINSIVVWSILGIYMFINHHQPPPENVVLMPSWVPFWPAFFPAYVLMLLMTWFLPVTIRDAARFRSCVRANVCAFLLVVPWWVLSPTEMSRPELPGGMWAYVYDWVWMVDQPYNVRPCAHGIGPLVAAWFVAQDRPLWRWPLAGVLVVGLASIALVWQHRPIDILLGTIAAGVGISIVTFLRPSNQWKKFVVNSSLLLNQSADRRPYEPVSKVVE